jgi:hypothetical protein
MVQNEIYCNKIMILEYVLKYLIDESQREMDNYKYYL